MVARGVLLGFASLHELLDRVAEAMRAGAHFPQRLGRPVKGRHDFVANGRQIGPLSVPPPASWRHEVEHLPPVALGDRGQANVHETEIYGNEQSGRALKQRPLGRLRASPNDGRDLERLGEAHRPPPRGVRDNVNAGLGEPSSAHAFEFEARVGTVLSELGKERRRAGVSRCFPRREKYSHG
jgi:hypothetical protein